MDSRFLSASRMVILALACIMTIISCTVDDGNSDTADGSSGKSYEEKKIIGTWVNGNVSYRFDIDGTGDYYAENIWGNIRYNLYGNTVYMNITYLNTKFHSIWHSELSGTYVSSDDTFRINDKVFHRK